MKTIIKSSALVFALALLSTGVFATSTAKTDTTITNDLTAKITYDDDTAAVAVNIDNATIGATTILIYDLDGNLLLTDKFDNAETTIKKSYLLEDAEEGSYVVKVATDETVLQK